MCGRYDCGMGAGLHNCRGFPMSMVEREIAAGGVKLLHRIPRNGAISGAIPYLLIWSGPMCTYVCLGTNDLERAIRFYDAALAALGLTRCVARDFESDA